ncbi:MAG: hypothetical protein ACRCUE_12835 [Bosea sp. (in: a-proteobacteria)]
MILRTTFSRSSTCAAIFLALTLASTPHADEREFGHERTACIAWDIHLRSMIEQRQMQATLSADEGEVILDEVKYASRQCEAGRFRNALDRFAGLHDLLSGEAEERDEQG